MTAGSAQGDACLVERLRAGDSGAFDELYRAHRYAVLAAVRDRASNPQAQADLVQEAFVRALERLDRLRDPAAFRPWLLSIARNAAVDQLRSDGRYGIADDRGLDRLGDPSADPQQWAELDELAARVRDGLVHLSRRDATALSLATQFGLSTDDLAAALGVSRSAAKVALHRARGRLRQALRLQTLAHRCAGTCDELRRLYDDGELLAATRHVERCATCSIFDAEVEGFGAGRQPVAAGADEADRSLNVTG